MAIAARIWLLTSVTFGAGWLVYTLTDNLLPPWTSLPAALIALFGSLPVLAVMLIALPLIKKHSIPILQKKLYLFLSCAGYCSAYGVAAGTFIGATEYGSALTTIFISIVVLSASALCAITVSPKNLTLYFTLEDHSTLKKYNKMETIINDSTGATQSRPNKILIKSVITGVLILVMLIPTIFIGNLVQERQGREAQVVTEVSDRWAQAQVLTGPYIYLPYKVTSVDVDKKVVERLTHLVIIPDNLDVNGQVTHELRVRSIFKVLLYRATLRNKGNFEFHIPKEIDSNLIQWKDAKICYGLSDFKGIDERLVVNFNGSEYELSPGLPSDDINERGLSAPIPLAATDEGKKILFNINLTIKGSGKLHFIPLSGNSRFTLRSGWASPSFDGNNLPSVRTIDDSGFTATWNFNKANLPFGTILRDFKYDQNSLAFGVTMVQPADGYAKTTGALSMRYFLLASHFLYFLLWR